MHSFQIKHILIPVDFSDTSLLALEHATFMAKLFKADVTLLHAIETYTYKVELYNFMPNAGDNSKVVKAIETKLEEMAGKLSTEIGSRVNAVVANGKIATQIAIEAEKCKADLIILGTHGAKGFEEFFIGSNAFRIVTESKIPVISIQAHAKKLGYEQIFLPIDNSSSSRQKVNHALTLAKKYNSKVHICGLISDDADEGMERVFSVKVKQAHEFLNNNKVSVTYEVLRSDNFAAATLKEAEKRKADLIMIMKGSDAEDNFTSIFLDRFAQHVVNHSKIPVMSITPHEGEFSVNMFTSAG